MNKTLWFRWIVFLLAAFYTARMVTVNDWSAAGGPLRYLTHWALCASLVSSALMLNISRGRLTRRFDGFVGMVFVINAMVVFLYWKLFFDDPKSVTSDGELGTWWVEYYLHLMGPLLQWIDAFFIHRGFRKPFFSGLALMGFIGSYVLWIEWVVQPLNTEPMGSVTSGLPYRFLNNLEWPGREAFYTSNIAVALVLLSVMVVLSLIYNRFRRVK